MCIYIYVYSYPYITKYCGMSYQRKLGGENNLRCADKSNDGWCESLHRSTLQQIAMKGGVRLCITLP